MWKLILLVSSHTLWSMKDILLDAMLELQSQAEIKKLQ